MQTCAACCLQVCDYRSNNQIEKGGKFFGSSFSGDNFSIFIQSLTINLTENWLTFARLLILFPCHILLCAFGTHVMIAKDYHVIK